jgi:hypothetical protein
MNYEKLVVALIDTAIYTAASSPSNLTLLLPSSSAFLGQYNQSHIYSKEKSEIFHNNIGNIIN